MCADACQANGVAVPQLPDELKAELEKFLPERRPSVIPSICSRQRRQTTIDGRYACF